jgi:hypothetical protein
VCVCGVCVCNIRPYSAGLQAGLSGVRVRQGLGIFLFPKASRPALGPTQHYNQWVSRALSLGVKRSGCEADHSPTEVKNAWNSTPTLQYAFMAWCSVKAQGQVYILPLPLTIPEYFSGLHFFHFLLR